MSTRLTLAAAILVALAILPGVSRSGLAATGTTAQTPPQGAAAQPAQPTMQDMMKMHEQMMAEMKAGDAKLDALVAEMNAATGDAKVTAVAAVASELVRQQKSMHDHMGQMHQQMMGGRGMMMMKK